MPTLVWPLPHRPVQLGWTWEYKTATDTALGVTEAGDEPSHHLEVHAPDDGQMIIIITFKGAIRDFFQSPHSAANCLQHVRSSGPGAIVCKSRATHLALSRASVMLRAFWYEGTAQLLSLTELKSHLFELYFIG